MIQCVPDWDVACGVSDIAMRSPEFSSTKDRWESFGHSRRSSLQRAAFVPDDFEELCWEDGQLLVVMPQKQSATSSPDGGTATDGQHVASPTGDLTIEKVENLETVVTDARRVADPPAGMSDDETVGWLQYPLDEPLETCCCEPNANLSYLAVQEGMDREGEALSEKSHPAVQIDKNSERSKYADFMHSRAGILENNFANASLTDQEPLSKIASTDLPNEVNFSSQATAKLASNRGPLNPFKTSSFGSNASERGSVTKKVSAVDTCTANGGSNSEIQEFETTTVSSQSLALQAASLSPCSSEQPGRGACMKFSHFSRSAAIMKASLHVLGMASGPLPSQRLKQVDRVAAEACMPRDLSIESTITSESPPGQGDASREDDEDVFLSGSNVPLCSSSTSVLRTMRRGTGDESVACNAEAVVISHGFGSCPSGDPVPATKKTTDDHEASERTVTSSSRGSGNSAGKAAKVDSVVRKRKVGETDDSECQSKALEDDLGDVKKLASSRPTAMKRRRAAEIHNQSERRRRDRINEKLKALQELIPNSNKTDKASVLDDAIEYLKTLQSQLQEMSYRSGMSVSPMLISHGAQHGQMPQTVSLPQMEMGIGFGVGGGVGRGVGMGTTSTATQNLHLPGSVVSGSMVPLVSVPILHTGSSVVENRTFILRQPMPLSSQVT